MRAGLGWANAALAFLLELTALALLGRGGWQLGGGGPSGVALAVLLPALAAGLWAVFAAPRAPRASTAARLAVQAVVFGGAVAALAASAPRPAFLLAAVVGVNLLVAVLVPVPHADRAPS